MDSVASRYAIALLSIAREENKIKDYIDEVSKIIEIFDDNEELLILLSSYGVSLDEKKQALKEIFEKYISQYILNMFYVIIDNKRGKYIKDICKEFVRIGLNELNIKKGVVYSTIQLSENQIKALEKKVSKSLNTNVTLTNVIDKTILGGFKIQVEDYIIDDTSKTRLEKLKNSLKEGGKLNNGN